MLLKPKIFVPRFKWVIKRWLDRGSLSPPLLRKSCCSFHVCPAAAELRWLGTTLRLHAVSSPSPGSLYTPPILHHYLFLELFSFFYNTSSYSSAWHILWCGNKWQMAWWKATMKRWSLNMTWRNDGDWRLLKAWYKWQLWLKYLDIE